MHPLGERPPRPRRDRKHELEPGQKFCPQCEGIMSYTASVDPGYQCPECGHFEDETSYSADNDYSPCGECDRTKFGVCHGNLRFPKSEHAEVQRSLERENQFWRNNERDDGGP